MEKLYDLKTILAVHNNDMDFVKTMAELFVELLPPLSEELKTAAHNKNFERLYFNSHKLKASIDLFHVASVQQTIRLLEEDGKNKGFSKSSKKDADFVNKIIVDCAKQLKQDLHLEIAG